MDNERRFKGMDTAQSIGVHNLVTDDKFYAEFEELCTHDTRIASSQLMRVH